MPRRPHLAHLLRLFAPLAALTVGSDASTIELRASTERVATALAWPDVRQETKPWSRWWWFGNIADEATLTARLEQYAAAGLGGLEITPIYGVRGYEERFVDFLSPRWMDLLAHTLQEAHRLDLGIDLATGTGWPFGGPWLDEAEAAHFMAHRTYRVAPGERLHEPVTFTPAGLVRVAGARQVQLGELRHPVTANENLQDLALDQVRFPQPLRLVTLMAFPAMPAPRAGGAAGPVGDLAESSPASAAGTDPGAGRDTDISPVDHASDFDLRATTDQPRRGHGLGSEATAPAGGPRLKGAAVDLTSRVRADGTLDWTAPADAGAWTLHAIFEGAHGKMVERAAPGGEGLALDHFSSAALARYLARFDAAFAEGQLLDDIRPGVRAFFNDSYEVDDAEGEANWTPRFLDEFQRRRGYDLRSRLPELLGDADRELVARVRSDYRETISDLLLDEFTQPWRAWAHRHGALIRNQAHNSPANVLDLYAASDIPEQEGNGLLAMKLASSAAHLTGKRLASAETATWLNEHFLTTLAELKHNSDGFLLAGINHLCYHGTALSPLDADWPGFNFYASVELNPANPFWPDFAALNAYVTRAQSFLQSGAPDEDVLLYYNIHDRWADAGSERMPHFGHGGSNPVGVTASTTAAALHQAGLGFDYVSDRLLSGVEVRDGGLAAADARYRALVVPATRFMPRATLERLLELAAAGATVLVEQHLPSDAPGIAGLQQREAFSSLLRQIQEHSTKQDGVVIARLGAGEIVVGPDLSALLAHAGLRAESLRRFGLEYVRRRSGADWIYFLVNRGDRAIDGWVSFQSARPHAAIFDPMTGYRGLAAVRPNDATASADVPAASAGAGARNARAPHQPHEVYLQLAPGASCFVRFSRDAIAGPAWRYRQPAGEPRALDGAWSVTFTRGGPMLPPVATLDAPSSWTEFAGEAGRAFSGTAVYSLQFDAPAGEAAAWELDLGTVCDSARVTVNGQELATLIQPPWRVVLPRELLRPHNTLEVAVTNLAANRIADLDRRNVPWKRFYNINFPARRRENVGPDGLFTAAHWAPRNSGLLGPVKLTPLRSLDPTL